MLQCHWSPAGALLFDARQLFEQQNARADEALRSIVGQLAEAVTTCVDAAAAELDPVRQAALMKVQGPALVPLPSCPCPGEGIGPCPHPCSHNSAVGLSCYQCLQQQVPCTVAFPPPVWDFQSG